MQALGLVREFAQGNASKFFDDRAWYPAGVKSRFEASGTFRADLVFETEADGRYLWQFNLGLRTGYNLREVIWHLPPDAAHPAKKMDHSRKRTIFYLNKELVFSGLRMRGSVMAFVEFGSNGGTESRLHEISKWAQKITSLELLSPTAMRGGARGPTDDIGTRGERLASFLASLSAGSRAKLVARLSEFYPIRNIETTKKRAGWVDMQIAENLGGVGAIGPSHASDGLLRLLALCAIPEFGRNAALVMLDEIENGIEPHILPEIIQRIVSDSDSQFVFTSHSPLLVNFFEPADIHILARRTDGAVATSRFSDLESWSEGLEFFGPGELWSMAEKRAIQQEFVGESQSSGHPKGDGPNRFSADRACAFMTERREYDD